MTGLLEVSIRIEGSHGVVVNNLSRLVSCIREVSTLFRLFL